MTNLEPNLAAIEVSATEFLRLSAFERFLDASGYKCRFAVQCGEFGCSRRDFYFVDLPRVAGALRECFRSPKGNVEMRQRYEHEFLTFDATAGGRFILKGRLTSYRDSDFRFALDADQT